MKTIIKEVIEEAENRIEIELKKIQKDIDDFTKKVKIPSVLDMSKREAYFKERMTGRLSTENLTKNYERKSELERQRKEIINFKFYNKEMFKQKIEGKK